jgi:ubiquinone/menaquinone biosynthesis C-methylase UbiE
VPARSARAIGVEDAYRLWSGTYDNDLNPIAALEHRIIREHLHPLSGRRVLDIGTGTGYWLAHAQSQGARAYGIDLSAEMLSEAAKKPGLRNRLIRADIARLPVADESADIAICSLAIGYVASVANLFRELARVSQRVVVSDLHEEAMNAGWRRCFEMAGRSWEIDNFPHTTRDLDKAASDSGLRIEWRFVAHLGEPEREIFVRAAREHAFADACSIPALLATCWVRS